MPPLVSVIVLNYNGARYLHSCLSSLLSQTYQPLEIIVADNGSTDNSCEIAATFARVKFVKLHKNYGFGKGNNLAAKHAKGDYLLFVNNDMRFAADMVEQLVRSASFLGNLFALDCRQLSWDGAEIINSATFLTPHRAGGISFVPGIDRIQFDVDEPVRVPFANGANLFCDANRFRALEGFDPVLFFTWEDVDLCWRAFLRGWDTWYVPQATCWHRLSGTVGNLDKEDDHFKALSFYYGPRGHYRFIMKCADARTNLRTLISLIHSLCCRVRDRNWVLFFTLLRAYGYNIFDFPRIYGSRRAIRRSARKPDSALFQQFFACKKDLER